MKTTLACPASGCCGPASRMVNSAAGAAGLPPSPLLPAACALVMLPTRLRKPNVLLVRGWRAARLAGRRAAPGAQDGGVPALAA